MREKKQKERIEGGGGEEEEASNTGRVLYNVSIIKPSPIAGQRRGTPLRGMFRSFPEAEAFRD